MTEIFLYEASVAPPLSPQNLAKCREKMNSGDVLAATAFQAMQVGNTKWCVGDTKGALASAKEARRYMLAAVNAKCDAVESECAKRGKP